MNIGAPPLDFSQLMGSWQKFLAEASGPIYLAIVDALANSIRAEEIGEGDRLPPQRKIASALQTDLTTVTRAFNEARNRGLIEATVGRGTFIRAGAGGYRSGNQREPTVVDLSMNLPPVPQDPSLQNLIQTDIAQLVRRNDLNDLMSYRVTGGTGEERRLAAHWIEPMTGLRDRDEILIVPGAQAAIAAVFSTLAGPGDNVITDRIAYPGVRTAASQFGVRLCGVDSDLEGMIPDQLEMACRLYKPRFIYCNPTIQNPTTATMSLERRKAIVAVAQTYDIPIVEDDPYSLLFDAPPPALAQLAPHNVFYISTLAKVLTPGLRLAFLVCPSAEKTQQMAKAIRAIALTNSGLLTSLATYWFRNGQAQAILHAIQKELRARQKIAREILGDGHCMHPDGPHAWIRLPNWWGSIDFVSYARRHGLALVPSNVFTVEGDPPQRVRVALGSAASIDTLATSLRGIATLLQHKRAPVFTDIV